MKYSREIIISEIKSIARKLNVKTLRKKDFIRNSSISVSSIRYYFGNFNNLLIAADLTPLTQEEKINELKNRNTIDDNVLLIDLLDLYYKHDKMTYDLINCDAKRSVTPYIDRWKTPQKALEEALKREKEGIIGVEENINSESKARNILDNYTNKKRKPKELFGQPIDFRGLRSAPINEQGVVYLFGMISGEMGFYIESIRTSFPDCEGKRCFDRNNDLWEYVKIEFEFKASNFLQHGHNPNECDIIICWKNDWKDCPIEVIELKEEIRRLSKIIDHI
jgi:hypothetical protein